MWGLAALGFCVLPDAVSAAAEGLQGGPGVRPEVGPEGLRSHADSNQNAYALPSRLTVIDISLEEPCILEAESQPIRR